MTLATTTNRVSYPGNGVATSFNIPFKFFANGDIELTQIDASGNGTPLTLGVSYTLTGAGSSGGGTANLTTPLPTGYTLLIKRVVDETQPTSFRGQSSFYPETHEDSFDRLTMVTQQLQEQLNRTPTGPESMTGPVLMDAPSEGTVLGWVGGRLRNLAAATAQLASNLMNSTDVALGDALVAVKRSISGSIATTLHNWIEGQVINVKTEFGATCDGVTDDTIACQNAINYCNSFSRAKTLKIPGRCLITSSLFIDRAVDTKNSDFRIIGEGEGAGFYTTTAFNLFDSSISYGSANAWGAFAPCSEFVTFENIHFETSSASAASYTLSGKFLRCKFINCRWEKMKFANASTSYAQSIQFIHCSIRNTTVLPFYLCLGSYDVSFNNCHIENNHLVFKSIPSSPGSNSGTRFISNVIEGANAVSGVGTVQVTGANGWLISGNHVEQNINANWNFGGGSTTNQDIVITGNFFVCDSGKVEFYHWTSANVTSIGNFMATTGTAGQLHNQVSRIVNFVSINDLVGSGGSIADSYLMTVAGNIKTNSGPGRSSQTIGGGGAFTINAADYSLMSCITGGVGSNSCNFPSGGVAGQRITIQITNSSAGAITSWTFTGNYKVQPWTSQATGTVRSIDFVFDGTYWREVGRSGDIPA